MPLARSLITLALLACPVLLRAHDPGLSSARLTVFTDRIELVVTFSTVDARWFFPESGSTAEQSEVLDFPSGKLPDQVPTPWHLKSGQIELSAQSTSIALAPGNNLIWTQSYPALSEDRLSFRSDVFASLPSGHRQHLSILNERGDVVTNKLLSSLEPEYELSRSSLFPSIVSTVAASPLEPARLSFSGFFRLGIEHILTGYDHLLFLFAFLVTARGVRSVLKTVTSFTVAHSLTLALSAFDFISFPARWVEALIAITIIIVALQNISARDRTTERVGLTFAFGLIHGFGFASVLRDIGISSLGTSAWRALAGFNAGVEVGQVAVASLIFPGILYLHSHPRFQRSFAPVASALIAVAGVYWLGQRVGWI